MSNETKRKLFWKLLDSRPEDKKIADDIYDRFYGVEEESEPGKKPNRTPPKPFTTEQMAFLGTRLHEFADRMAFAEEAQKLLNPKEIKRIASGHDLLHTILKMNASAAEMMQEHLTVLAMEKPDVLREMMAAKREIDEKKKSEEKAVAREESWGDAGRDTLLTIASVLAEGASDLGKHMGGMLGALAGRATEIATGGAHKGAPAGGEKKGEKEPKKKETKPEEENLDGVEQYENPVELFERFSILLGEDVEDARKLLKKNLVKNEQTEEDDKKIFALLKKGKKDDAHKLLKTRLKIPDANEGNK